ncbi:MAG: hypothetical protein V1702_03985 [Candidatus Woesearchaeota archaeon]
MKKRGQMMMGSRKIASYGLGFVMLVLGLIPLLNLFSVISFSIPVIPMMILYVLAVIAGILLFWDGISEGMSAMGMGQMLMFASYALAIASLAIGIVPILGALNVIAFSFGFIGTTIVYALFVIDGILLIFGGTQGF